MLQLSADEIKNFSIFYPYAFEKTINALSIGHPFVHYCSSAAAASMIQNGHVWMRNVTWMNDSSEIIHGKACLADALASEPAHKLAEVLDEHFPGFTSQLIDIFSSWLIHFEQETYITCLTEQLVNEEQMGRLSMWRAYGAGANPVAFVVNSGPFLRPSDALNAYTSPVCYLSKEQFRERYTKVVVNIVENMEFLKVLGRDHIFANLFAAYRYAVVCTKHPSFHEEREWRIIYQPTFLKSKRLLEDRVTINGNPQRIYKIPMSDIPEEGFYGATLPELFCKLLIGPSPTAQHLRREFIHMLEEQGVQDAAAKVEISDVPLRVS